MTDVETEKIRREIDRHEHRCPAHIIATSVQGSVEDLKREFREHRQSMETVRDGFRDGAIKFNSIEERNAAQDERLDRCEAFVGEVQSFLRRIAMRIIIALVLAAAASVGAGHGVIAIIKAIGD